MKGDGVAYIGSLIGLIAFIKAILPAEFWDYSILLLRRIISRSSSKARLQIHEFVGSAANELFEVVDLHIASITRTNRSVERLELSRLKHGGQPSYTLADEELIADEFQGHTFTWIYHSKPRKGEYRRHNNKISDMRRSYSLVVDKSLKNTMLPLYLDHINKHAEELRHKTKKRMLYTNFQGNDWEFRKHPWRPVLFNHPATFESMAMDPELKERIRSDLRAFMSGEKYFRRIGRAWKRGYLLYGPPGTGKSSLIAAIAAFTGYDIYDLELTDVKSNSELRKYLTAVPSKSIVVIEDIDCSIDLKKRASRPSPKIKKTEELDDGDDEDFQGDEKSRVTLSGLLNFTDGLWSSTGSERIIIFTTNHIDQLDPALIRTGRMDMHIYMGYCNFASFKVLALTHLEIEDHELFREIEQLISKVEITPADVAELLIQNKNSPTAALERLVDALKRKPRVEERVEDSASFILI